MDPLPHLRNFLARLAGAPAAPPAARWKDVPRPRERSGPGERADPGVAAGPRTSRQHDGDHAEAFARRYLECAGMTFVAANVRYRDGEIDLVMRDPRNGGDRNDGERVRRRTAQDRMTIVFVEVRRRARDSHGGAAASVTTAKRHRLVAAASHYLVGLGLRTLPPCRFDVVAIEGDVASDYRVEWVRNAFQDDGR